MPESSRLDGRGMRSAIITGSSAVAFAIGGYVMPIVIPQLDPEISRWLLYLAGGLLVLAFALWLWGLKKTGDSGSSVNQTSHGHGAANLQGVFHGPITVNSHHPMTQERKSPYGSASPTISRRQRREYVTWDMPREKINPTPNFPLNGLLIRLYAIHGPVPQGSSATDAFHKKIDLLIADKVVGEGAHVWGRLGKRALAPIDLDEWRRGILDHRKGALTLQALYNSDYDLTDLHFWKHEIDRIWPEPLRTTNDGKD